MKGAGLANAPANKKSPSARAEGLLNLVAGARFELTTFRL